LIPPAGRVNAARNPDENAANSTDCPGARDAMAGACGPQKKGGKGMALAYIGDP